MSNDVLDLDALKPKPIKVRIGGEVVDIPAPSFAQMLDVMEMEPKIAKAKDLDAVHLMIEQLSILIGEEHAALLTTLTERQLSALQDHLGARFGLSAKKKARPRRRKT